MPHGAELFRRSFDGSAVLEKALLFFPMIIGAVITLMVIQRKNVSFIDLSRVLPSLETLEGAIVAYAKYLYLMVWPSGLAIPYPASESNSPCGSCCFPWLCCRPFLFWHTGEGGKIHIYWPAGFGILSPCYRSSGWFRAGLISQADRYTYVPLIGVFIMIAWGAADLFAKSRHRQWILGIGAALCILVCMAVSSGTSGSLGKHPHHFQSQCQGY